MANFFGNPLKGWIIKPRTWIIAGAIMIGIIVAAFLIPGWFKAQKVSAAADRQTEIVQTGSLSTTISATGAVRARQSAALTWQAAGIVGSVNAELGSRVKKDQKMAALDRTSLDQSVILAEVDRNDARDALDELQQSETQKAQALVNLNTAKQDLEDAQDDYDQVHVARATDERLGIAENDYDLALTQYEQSVDKFNEVQYQPLDDPIRVQRYEAMVSARTRKDEMYVTWQYLAGKPDSLEVGKREAALELAKAKLADAQREWDRLKDGPTTQDLAAAQAKVDAAQATLNSAYILAPFAGTITRQDVITGDLVSVGTPAFRLDDLTHLLVDVQISEVDINQVSVGQKAEIVFDAVGEKVYHGLVNEIARAGETTNGAVNFTVTLEMEDPDEAVKPGMTAVVEITTTQLDHALLVPNRGIRLLNGERVVYVQRGLTTAAEKIVLGAIGDRYSQVIEGNLKAGDVLILSPVDVADSNASAGAAPTGEQPVSIPLGGS